MKISTETRIKAPIDKIWKEYSNPDDIVLWNTASEDWHTVSSRVDLKAGGEFCSMMEAKDGSLSFDFAGKYTRIVRNELIEYVFGDREGRVEFVEDKDETLVRVTFDAENENSLEQQREGWQAILDNFKKHVLR